MGCAIASWDQGPLYCYWYARWDKERAVRPLDEEAGRTEERQCDELPEDESLCAQGLHGDTNVADQHAEVKSVAPLVPDTRCRDAITHREMRVSSAGTGTRDGTGKPVAGL